VFPESSAVRVPVGASIRIQFSEKVDEPSLERALWVTPGGAVKPRINFHGTTAEIKLGHTLPESTTISVLVTTLLRDRRAATRENQMSRPQHWIFSTGDTVWPGRIHGTLEEVGIPAGQGLVLVALFDTQGDSVPNPTTADPVAVTEPDSSGRFELDGLRLSPAPRWLFALYDRDGNREIHGQGEFASAVPESILFAPGHPDMQVKLRLVDPRAPSTLEGTIVSTAADTVAKWIELTRVGADSATAPVKRTPVGKKGAFSLGNIPPGPYRLVVYCDLNGNGKHEPEEPASAYGKIDLAPGSKRQIGNWRVTGCLP
jgi:Big-like domain-containing protein